jgi:hypothetical protein
MSRKLMKTNGLKSKIVKNKELAALDVMSRGKMATSLVWSPRVLFKMLQIEAGRRATIRV